MRHSVKLTLVVLVGLLITGVPAMTQSAGETAKEVTNGWGNKILTFIQTIAEYIGKALVGIIDQVANVELDELQVPLGYLGVLTLFLGALTIVSAAKKVLWFVLIMGWGLIIVRIVTEILSKKQI